MTDPAPSSAPGPAQVAFFANLRTRMADPAAVAADRDTVSPLSVSLPPPLGPDQQRVYDRVMQGGNAFISGPAGTGKSFLLDRIVRDLRRRGKSVAVTASTGIAAMHVGGSTIHSFLGTGLCGSTVQLRQRRVRLENRPQIAERVCEADVLVVDEVSMLTGDYVDMADAWLAYVRQRRAGREETPFGGLQVILCGDFLQLPPVQMADDRARRVYAFEAAGWARAKVEPFLLQQNFRQADGAFVAHLLRLRRGEVPNDTREFFRPCVRRGLDNPTWLCAHNETAQTRNQEELAKLPGEAQTYEATFSGHETWQDALRKSCIAEPTLTLKPDAPVVFLKNDPHGAYVNGLRGRVRAAAPGLVTVETDRGATVTLTPAKWQYLDATGAVLATMSQYPCKLAWALTIHKSQGMTLDRVWCDLSRVFETGHAYVALSRARTVEGLGLAYPLVGGHIKVSRAAAAFYGKLAG